MNSTLVIMGVSGSGKTTIGKLLAERFSLRFFDGDDYHSKNNVQKMSRGEPLTDEDREDWLASLAELIQSEPPIVLACSALKTEYREYLSESDIGLRFVFLDVPFEVAKNRLASRDGHFMPVSLLDSQFETLQRPQDAIHIQAEEPVLVIVDQVEKALSRLAHENK